MQAGINMGKNVQRTSKTSAKFHCFRERTDLSPIFVITRKPQEKTPLRRHTCSPDDCKSLQTRGEREMSRADWYKLLEVLFQRSWGGRPAFLQRCCSFSWHQLGLLQPRCPIDFCSPSMRRQPIMADWLRIDWIVTWNLDLFFSV